MRLFAFQPHSFSFWYLHSLSISSRFSFQLSFFCFIVPNPRTHFSRHWWRMTIVLFQKVCVIRWTKHCCLFIDNECLSCAFQLTAESWKPRNDRIEFPDWWKSQQNDDFDIIVAWFSQGLSKKSQKSHQHKAIAFIASYLPVTLAGASCAIYSCYLTQNLILLVPIQIGIWEMQVYQ